MEKLVSDMGRRGFDRMRSPRAATMIALASATGHARTLPASRTGAGEMTPCHVQAATGWLAAGYVVADVDYAQRRVRSRRGSAESGTGYGAS